MLSKDWVVMSWEIIEEDGFDKIVSDNTTAKIAHLGAELISFQVKKDDKWVPILVNDNQISPDVSYWKRHAPFLFPIVGGLHNDKSITTDGKSIELPSHGYARISKFTKINESTAEDSASVTYQLSWNNSSNEMKFPWNNKLLITYVISSYQVDIKIDIKNESDSDMWFQFGWHPGFLAPISMDSSKRKDVLIELSKGEYTLKGINKNCNLTGDDKVIHIEKPLQLTDEELEDTYILDASNVDKREISLYDTESNIRIKLEYSDYPHLGLWAMKDAPYICLEPWQGCDDSVVQESFDKKFGITALKPQSTDSRNLTLKVDL